MRVCVVTAEERVVFTADEGASLNIYPDDHQLLWVVAKPKSGAETVVATFLHWDHWMLIPDEEAAVRLVSEEG